MTRYDASGRPLPAHAPFAAAPFAPAPPPEAQTRQPGTCARCGRQLVYIEMAKTGKLNPCDREQRYGDGTRHLIQRVVVGKKLVGQMVRFAGEDVLGFEPHWGTCSARDAATPATPTAAPPTQTELPCPVYQLPPR